MEPIDCAGGVLPGGVKTYTGKLLNVSLNAKGISGLIATPHAGATSEASVAFFAVAEKSVSLWTEREPMANLFPEGNAAVVGAFPASFGRGGLGGRKSDDAKERLLVARDGSDGWWGPVEDELVHWTREKGIEHLDPELLRSIGNARTIRALAWDPVRKAVVIAKQKEKKREPGEPLTLEALPSEIVVLESGRVTRMDIQIPKVCNSLSPLFLATRNGVTALAIEGVLLRIRNREVTVVYDEEGREDLKRGERSARGDTFQHLLTIGLGFGAGVAGGAGIAAQPDSSRYHRTLGETFAGSLVGAGGNILFLAGGGALFGGDIRGVGWTSDLGRGIAGAGMLIGALTGPPLTALGSYGSSELFYRGNPDANYLTALGGAYLGAGIGLVTHSVVCRLTKSPFVRELSLSIATGFVGGMSSWAIHNAGAGAK